MSCCLFWDWGQTVCMFAASQTGGGVSASTGTAVALHVDVADDMLMPRIVGLAPPHSTITSPVVAHGQALSGACGVAAIQDRVTENATASTHTRSKAGGDDMKTNATGHRTPGAGAGAAPAVEHIRVSDASMAFLNDTTRLHTVGSALCHVSSPSSNDTLLILAEHMCFLGLLLARPSTPSTASGPEAMAHTGIPWDAQVPRYRQIIVHATKPTTDMYTAILDAAPDTGQPPARLHVTSHLAEVVHTAVVGVDGVGDGNADGACVTSPWEPAVVYCEVVSPTGLVRADVLAILQAWRRMVAMEMRPGPHTVLPSAVQAKAMLIECPDLLRSYKVCLVRPTCQGLYVSCTVSNFVFCAFGENNETILEQHSTGAVCCFTFACVLGGVKRWCLDVHALYRQ